jgi:hypothetical protein
MIVSIGSGANQETGTLAFAPGDPNGSGSQGAPGTSGVELFSPLSNAHAAGTVVDGQGWEVQANTPTAPLAAWAICAK